MQATKWRETHYVTAYILAKQGYTDAKISACLGVEPPLFSKWRKKRPALNEALNLARDADGKDCVKDFRDYVLGRLPDHLQDLWDEINLCDSVPYGTARLKQMLDNRGTRIRQHLFLYALVACDFDASEACKKVCIQKGTLNQWQAGDPEFAELLDEIHEAKKDFLEGRLLRLVKQGNAAAIIFANKTLNKDRGYGDSKTVRHEGGVEHTHTHTHRHVRIADLNLPPDALELLYDRMQAAGLLDDHGVVPPPPVFVESDHEPQAAAQDDDG